MIYKFFLFLDEILNLHKHTIFCLFTYISIIDLSCERIASSKYVECKSRHLAHSRLQLTQSVTCFPIHLSLLETRSMNWKWDCAADSMFTICAFVYVGHSCIVHVHSLFSYIKDKTSRHSDFFLSFYSILKSILCASISAPID